MPVDMSRYPGHWPEIRRQVLLRAGGRPDDPRVGARCEQCGVLNYAVGRRDGEGVFRPERGNIYLDAYQYATSYTAARQVADSRNEINSEGHCVVIVLTIAHVDDPDPMSCDLDNLAAWCQACHNRHDAAMRRRNRILNTGQMELFAGGAGTA